MTIFKFAYSLNRELPELGTSIGG